MNTLGGKFASIRAAVWNNNDEIQENPGSAPEENEMKKKFLALGMLVMGASGSFAAQTPMAGTIVSESSVECGTKKQGKKESTNLLCQQYTVRTATAEYQIPAAEAGEQINSSGEYADRVHVEQGQNEVQGEWEELRISYCGDVGRRWADEVVPDFICSKFVGAVSSEAEAHFLRNIIVGAEALKLYPLEPFEIELEPNSRNCRPSQLLFLVAEEFVALFAEEAADNGDMVIAFVEYEAAGDQAGAPLVNFRAMRATIGVNVFLRDAKDDGANFRPHAGTGAHGARLVRGIENEVRKITAVSAGNIF